MKTKKHLYYLLFDAIIVTFSFLFISALKPATLTYYLPVYSYPFIGFLFLWIIVSIVNKKYILLETGSLRIQFANILKTNFIVLAILILIIYGFQLFNYSRLIILGTAILSTIIEIFFVYFFVSLVIKTHTYYDPETETFTQKSRISDQDPKPEILHDTTRRPSVDTEVTEKIKNLITEDSGEKVFNFVSSIVGICRDKCVVLSTTTILNILFLPSEDYKTIINLKKINEIRRINKFFEAVNNKLSQESLFFCCVETYLLRKKRILSRLPFILNYIYYFFDYLFTRVFPKLPVTKTLYFSITGGNSRVLSKAETFGRLYSCGFKVIAEKYINRRLYIAAIKVKKPAYDPHPTYGLFIKLKRLGKNGKIIKLYKIRTMHAYAEYLQDYIYEKNNIQEGGKFKNDFRRSTTGKFMRRLWLDEIPSIINFLKGDIKLVGVRPISEQYFNLYTEEHKQRRLKYKPGLIPPYYANLPKTLDEIIASEKKFMDEYDKSPYKTNIKYFFKVMYNIIFRNVRSD